MVAAICMRYGRQLGCHVVEFVVLAFVVLISFKGLFLFEPGNSSFTTTRAVAVAVLSKVRKPVSSTAFRSFRQAAHCVQPMATRPRAALSSTVCARVQGW